MAVGYADAATPALRGTGHGHDGRSRGAQARPWAAHMVAPDSLSASLRRRPGPSASARRNHAVRRPTSSSSVVTCEMWGFGLMLVRSRETAAAGGRGAQATHRGPIGAGARARLHTMIGRGVAPASALTHARILLKANQVRPVLHG